MANKEYMYSIAFCSTGISFFLACVGVFNPNWWVLKYGDGRIVDNFDLFGNLRCFDDYCVATYVAGHSDVTKGGHRETAGWLTAVRLLCILNCLTLFVALIIQITHSQYNRIQFLWASLALLAASVTITLITTAVLICKIQTLSAYSSHSYEDAALDIQALPLVVLIMSTPCCIVSMLVISLAVCTRKQSSYSAV